MVVTFGLERGFGFDFAVSPIDITNSCVEDIEAGLSRFMAQLLEGLQMWGDPPEMGVSWGFHGFP